MPNIVDIQTVEGLTDTRSFRTQALVQATAAVTTSLTVASEASIMFTGTVVGQIVALGNATTYTVGHRYEIHNNSTQNVVLHNNPGTTLATIGAGQRASVILQNNTTAAGIWAIVLGGASVVTTNLGVVQKRRTTTYTMTGSFASITFNTLDIESNSAVVDADPVNTDRIRIQETGLYQISFTLNTEISASGSISYRAFVNNTTAILGSQQVIDGGDELSVVECYANLTAGDFVTVQLQNTGGSGTIVANALFCIERCTGAQGPQGAAGGSTITVQEEGSTVASNISQINFVGPTTTVTSPGAGQIVVTTLSGGFGANYAYITSDSLDTTNSTTYQVKATLSTGSIPAGTYRVGWHYNWYYTSTSRRFDVRVRLNDTTDIGEHLEEPSDSATNQRRSPGGFANITVGASTNSITLEYRSSNGSDTAGIANARLEFWRVQ